MAVKQKLEGNQQQASAGPAAASQPSWFLNFARRLAQILLAHADFLVALLLMGFVGHYYLAQKIPLLVREIEFFDNSWELDLLTKAHRGIWLGRDIIFTRGPLFQWLLTWAPLRYGMSLGSFYLYLWVVHYWTTIVALYAMGALLLNRQPSWVRVFYLLLMLVFWVPVHWIIFNIKFLLPLCSFAVLLRTFPDPGTRVSSLSWRAALAASLIAISFLLSDDSGFYTAAAFMAVLPAFLFYQRSYSALGTVARYAALTVTWFAAWMLTINWATGKLLDFHFWRAAYEVATQYRWSQYMHMQPEMTPIFWLGVAINLLIFAGYWLIYRTTPGTAGRDRASRLAMLGFALIGLQLILVCPETLHVATGLFPWIALSCALLLGATESRLSVLRLVISLTVIFVLTAAFSGPNHLFAPGNLGQDRSAITSVHSCPQGLYEIDGVCLKLNNFVELKTVRDFLVQHTNDSDSIGIFPYQSVYTFMARRSAAGEVVQHYITAGDYLNQRQMASLERARAPWAIYAAEPWQSQPCNGVTNFTRNPRIWLYWQRWYSDNFDALPGLLVLRRDEERGKRWQMTSTSILPHPVQGGGDDEIALPAGSFGDDLDFIKIDVRVEYPMWWKLLRPSTLVAKLRFENGDEKTLEVIAQPNHADEIWLYPWEQAQLANYFSSSPGQWRSGARPRIQSLSLRSERMDWIGVQPSRIKIQDVQMVKLSEQ